MPYSSVSELPANVKSKPAKTQRQWMHVWNGAFQACMARDEGGTKECESEAFAKANGVIKGGEMPDGDLIQLNQFLLEKTDKKVNYREQADGKDWSCGDCRFFSYNRCSLVEGSIEPSFTCDLYTEKLPSQSTPPGLMYNEEGFQVFVETEIFAEKSKKLPDWIPFLPKPGKFKHALYGEVEITKEGNQERVDSVNNVIYQEHIPLDAEHQTKLSGAVGWIKKLRLNTDGSADAFVEWSERGKTLVGGGGFKYISPEWFSLWPDPATGTVHKNVVSGGAITTRPFFKDKALRALVASENGIEVIKATDNKEDPTVGDENKTPPPAPEPTPTPTPEPTPQPTGDPKTATFAEIAETPEAKAFIEAKIAEAVKAKDAEAQTFAEQLKAQVKANEALADRLGSIERADRTRRFTDLVAGRGGANDGGPWAGDAEANVKFLEDFAEKFGEDSETFKNWVTQQNAIAAQLKTASSGAFSEVGSTGGALRMTDPEQRLDALAKEKAKEGKTYERAYAEVLETEEGRRLYGEMDSARVRGTGS